ncbi:hypothetical protein LJC30_01340 [Odoribacter sp. OttesenSCG-928-L07]|nr:hypothetical protein [Odoribacter sp. OttesenSCG-928-L07]MDL2240766.1 hypothetical protein [Bacteroidales bacterium OttesenSCG-928-K22]
MKAYKIRICSEENEDFLREIEILGDQNFLDLHDFIVEICDLNGNDLASFYTCDNDWNKQMEISLLDMSIDEKNTNKDDDEEYLSLPMKVMEDTLIAHIIKSEGQKLLYEYDFLSPVTLFVQCVEIQETESDEYPICLYEEGELEYKGGFIDDISSDYFEDLDDDEDNNSLEDEIFDEFNEFTNDNYDDDMY